MIFFYIGNDGLKGKMVSSLFDVHGDYWGVDLLHVMFDPRDVQLIESIHIRRQEDDSWHWKCEKMGQYSVKSAYLSIQKNR